MRNLRPGRYDGFFESYKSEIAAYKLDRLLELDMVPPTVEVRYNGELASLQLWVHDTKMLKQVNEKKLRAPDPEKWNYQLHRTYLFDDLVGNIDENQGNLLFDPQWNFIKIDCSRCFTDMLVQPFEIGKKLTQIDRPFFDRIKALDKATVKGEIGDLLEGHVKHEPTETELPVERQYGPAQHGKLAQRLVLGVLLEGLEPAGDVDEPGQALAQGRDRRAGRTGDLSARVGEARQ